MSVTVQLDLAEAVATEAKAKGLLDPKNLTPTMLADSLRQKVTWSADTPVPLPPQLRDPKDLMVLAAALSPRADAIVTGDDDLLSMKSFEGIPIIKAREALEKLGLPAE